MRPWLKDLKPGDEFEYVVTTQAYRRGRFVVLNNVGSYLEPVAKEGCAFVFSFLTNKVCQHWGLHDVNLISKTKENNMKNSTSMGHFVGWKFGVPVKIWNHYHKKVIESKLVWENDDGFRVVSESGYVVYYSKDNYTYELIPHEYSHFSPRYPVCQTSNYTAFCNSGCEIDILDAVIGKLKHYPVATLTIDGKTIELSTETTAKLKEKLGI